jgi:uncharacterized protein
MIRTLLAPLALLGLAGCGNTPAPPAASSARPALWKVVDADTTIYLFGTIHLLPKGLDWTTPTMERAMAASQALVLEVVLDKDPGTMAAIMTRLQSTPGLPPLRDRVPPEKRAALAKLVKASGISAVYLDSLETWAAALALSSSALARLDLTHAEGAETQLNKVFAAARKPITGLETAEQQMRFFDGLPEAAQRVFLASVADDDADLNKEFLAMIAAWKAGDIRTIAVTFDEEAKLSPELTDVLLRRRNAAWAAWIDTRMKVPGTVFLAVGAGHLAGQGSVDALVALKGHKVERVQ